MPGGVQAFGEQNPISRNTVICPDPTRLGLCSQTGIFTGFYFLCGILRLFGGIGCINQIVVSQRHRLCLLEPERDL